MGYGELSLLNLYSVVCNFNAHNRKLSRILNLVLQDEFLMLCPTHASQKFPNERSKKPYVKKCSSSQAPEISQ